MTFQKLLDKYPGRVPVILDDPDNILKNSRKKFLVPKYYTVQQFMCVVRNRNQILLNSKTALFLTLSGNCIPNSGMSLNELYNTKNKDEDGMLHMIVKKENVFGKVV